MQKLLLIALLAYVSMGKAQSTNVPAILKRLHQENSAVVVYSYANANILPIEDLAKNFKYTGQEVTKTREGVFLNPLGTGRLYKLVKISDSLRWKRIDTTLYTGYNFGSFFFAIDTTLYSFAGQGFFNLNGNLRYFNEETKEWDAANLSDAIFWLAKGGNFISIDTAEKHLTVEAWPNYQDQTLKHRINEQLINSLWTLDIQTGDWTKLGKINEPKTFTLAETPYGTLVNFNKIIDVKNNKVYLLNKKLSSHLINMLGSSSHPYELTYSFCIDSIFYIGDGKDFIDSVVLSKKDFIESEVPFYTPVEAESPISEREALIGLIIVLCLTTAFLLYRNNYKRSSAPVAMVSNIQGSITQENDKKETQVTFRSGKLMELLNEREKLLLEFIYNHSLDERLTTIEEINKVIGASQRTPEVQKRLRSDLIGAINDKLELVSESKFNVIEKQRSEFDKRSFEYFIHPDHMELVEKVLGKKLTD